MVAYFMTILQTYLLFKVYWLYNQYEKYIHSYIIDLKHTFQYYWNSLVK